MSESTRRWKLRNGRVRSSQHDTARQADRVKLCARLMKRGESERAPVCEVLTLKAQSRGGMVPRAEALDGHQGRHFVAKRWKGASGLVHKCLSGQGGVLVAHWDAGHEFKVDVALHRTRTLTFDYILR